MQPGERGGGGREAKEVDKKLEIVWNRILYVLEWFVGKDTSLENPVHSDGKTIGIVRQMYTRYLYLK